MHWSVEPAEAMKLCCWLKGGDGLYTVHDAHGPATEVYCPYPGPNSWTEKSQSTCKGGSNATFGGAWQCILRMRDVGHGAVRHSLDFRHRQRSQRSSSLGCLHYGYRRRPQYGVPHRQQRHWVLHGPVAAAGELPAGCGQDRLSRIRAGWFSAIHAAESRRARDA